MRLTVAVAVAVAVLLVVLTKTTSDTAPARAPVVHVDVAVPRDLGTARTTPAVRHWMSRLKAVCVKRNWGVRELNIRQGGTRPLGARPYAERVLANWREFEHGLARLRAPRRYAAEARLIDRVDDAKGRLIRAVHDATFAGDYVAVRANEAEYRRLSNKTNPGFIKIGLFEYGQFEAQQR